MKKVLLIILAFTLLFTSACGKKNKEVYDFKKPDENHGDLVDTEKDNEEEIEEVTENGDTLVIEKAAYIKQDHRELIMVELLNKKANIYFNLTRLEDLYQVESLEVPEDLTYIYKGDRYYGPFEIVTQGPWVKDIFVLTNENLFDYMYWDVPSVFLLMEDGKVEWLTAI